MRKALAEVRTAGGEQGVTGVRSHRGVWRWLQLLSLCTKHCCSIDSICSHLADEAAAIITLCRDNRRGKRWQLRRDL